MEFFRFRSSDEVANDMREKLNLAERPERPDPDLAKMQDAADEAQRDLLKKQDRLMRLKDKLKDDLDKDAFKDLYSEIQYQEKVVAKAEAIKRERDEAVAQHIDKDFQRKQLAEQTRKLAELQREYDAAYTDFKSAEEQFTALKRALPAKGSRLQHLMALLADAKTEIAKMPAPVKEMDFYA